MDDKIGEYHLSRRTMQKKSEETKNSRRKEKSVEQREQQHKIVQLMPKNSKQAKYIKFLEDPNNVITIAVGPAGTGKTMIAAFAAIKALQTGQVEKIIITRPAVSVDEQHGFLPGSLVEKMEPWVLPILDYFYKFYTKQQILQMINKNQIEIAPLAYMRGRSFANTFILLDEAQNCTDNQIKMALTRISYGSKMVITGDVSQHDRGFENNGLKDLIKRFDGQPGIEHVDFVDKDVERHPIIKTILEMYNS